MPGVCPRCLREVYFAEEKLALGKVWHTFCFSCRNCRKLLDSCTVATHCGELFCRNCCTRLFTPTVQSPSPPPTSNLIVEDRGPPFPVGRTPVSACDSVSDCYCCCCHPEDYSTSEVRPETRVTPREKHRLRGGGGEEEESEELKLDRETRRCSESDCSNLGVVSSVTTLCNVPSSPTAVTTWYNRQHSTSQSTFGGQTCTKKRLSRPFGTSNPGTAVSNFRSNNSDCLNGGSNCSNGKHKCVDSVVRRPESPRRLLIQQGENQEQQLKQSPQAQQLQLQLDQRQLQNQLPSQQSQQQKQLQKHQHQHQHSKEKSNQERIQQQVKNLILDSKNKNNSHQTSFRHLRTSKSEKCISSPERSAPGQSTVKITSYETESEIGANINYLRKKLARSSSPPPPPPATTFNHHQFPKRRVSFCSDVPEETNSSISEISSCGMKMPNENNNHFHGNSSSGSGITTTSNHGNNCTSSNGTPYETCCEMDDSNPPGYSTPRSSPSCNCTPGTFEDENKQMVSFESEEADSRLRGGCGGGRSGGCGSCGGCGGCPTVQIIQPCPPRDECREPPTPCGVAPRCCSPAGCRPVCKKPTRSCCPPCTAEPQGCGSGGCCGGGCRGGCGKPGRPCMPLRPCSTPPCQQPSTCRPRGSPCMPPRCCPPVPPCCKPPGVTFRPSCGIGGGGSCCRSKSPRRGCCSSPQDDGCCGYCGPKLPAGCECLGGGLDCQRCGRKVYQAEMQIASGVPYHNICFSCFCCRKPLEPLTYQENCGEIYCKQCYVRNFGPQGYGYGAGAGALQTPL